MGCRIAALNAGTIPKTIPVPEEKPNANTTDHFDQLKAFCKDIDILIHDAQYLPADMPIKRDWGHSLVEDTCRLARDANVKELILFHHDPNRTDSEIDGILDDAKDWFKKEGCPTGCRAAFDGMMVSLC